MASASTFSPSQLLALYRGLIRPCTEYGSHIWRGLTHIALLNRVGSKAFRFINSPSLTDCIDTYSHWRNVASLSLFYRHFHADCSSELANCMPPPIPQSCCTRLSTSHPYYIHISNTRVYQYLHSFIPYTGKLWNSLLLSVFSPDYDLNSFKPLTLTWTSTPCLYFSYCPLYRAWQNAGFLARPF